MLTTADNELLTRVGATRGSGKLMRCYWLPILLSSELPVRDGQPLRVSILGKSLVAFRDTMGSIGLLDQHCPHRRVDITAATSKAGCAASITVGNSILLAIVSTSEQKLAFKDSIRARAFRCVERNGTIWAYLGGGEAPPLPEFEWALVPPDQRYITKRVLECNWAQALEGDIDTAHASFLHSRLNPADYDSLEGARELRITTTATEIHIMKLPRPVTGS